MASSSSPTSIVFPPFRLDLRAGQLLRDRTPVHLRPKTFAVLCYLAERPGELVTKDALLDAVWNDVVVSQDVVRISAGELRAALDDDWTSPRFIETVHRRGYRFVAALENDRGPELGASGNAATADGILVGYAPALPDRPSIVVLPFTNMSGEAEQDYFADGMVEDVVTALSRFKELFVIARNSAFVYKGCPVDVQQVGRELGVRYVLEGSVRKAGNKVRITAQLIDATTGTHLWADHFDGPLEDIFDLQDRVTGRVVSAIAPKLQQAELERSTRKPTESLDAYDYYLRGVSLSMRPTKESNDEALRLLYKAIEIDPDFAAPYGAAARCYTFRKAFGLTTNHEAEIEETSRLAQSAIKLGADDAFALGASGFAIFYVTEDVESGAHYVERALSVNPNLAIAWGGAGLINICLGQSDKGTRQIEHAMRLSPLDPSMGLWQSGIALAHFNAGRDAEAVSWATMSLRSIGYVKNTLAILAASQAFLGRTEDAARTVAQLRSVDPRYRLSDIPDLNLSRRAQDRERFIEGLRLAGLPE